MSAFFQNGFIEAQNRMARTHIARELSHVCPACRRKNDAYRAKRNDELQGAKRKKKMEAKDDNR